MITFEELKAIEKSRYYETFKSRISQLTGTLFTLINDPHMYKNGDDSISQENMSLLGYYRSYLRNLVYGETDEIKRKSLENLKELPDFLKKKAFDDQVNSPTILERMYEVEQTGNYHKGALQNTLGDVVKALEMDLNDELCTEKLGTDREIWSKPAAVTFPAREEAKPGTWAALFYSLTKDSAKPNAHKDVSVYEHKVSDNTILRMTAMLHVAQGKGGDPVPIKAELEKEMAAVRKNPLAAMTLRNEHTVELLRRGSYKEVGDRLIQTKEDFAFKSKQEFADARTRAYAILNKMKNMEGKAASSPEFAALKRAVNNFAISKGDEENLERESAKVLEAVENFTKGRKNVQRSARAQECVNLALDALVSLVPNAAKNPHVKPLINRFNQVRSAKNRIDLSKFGADRTYTVEDAKKDRAKGLTGFDQESVGAVAEAMGELHDGRIDPAVFKNVSDLVVKHRNEIPAIMLNVKNGDESERKAAAALLEDMSANPVMLNGVKEMTNQEVKRVLNAKLTELSTQNIMRSTIQP